jgi:2-polyprenyl-3-methyl-5-hydroxy-6-metoxy-1,4-benzoquinol methylase
MNTHVCPWWLGYFLIIPWRKRMHNPEKIIGPHLSPGMKVIDYGSAMGYFSLPMASMVSSSGKVYCFDIQQKMLNKLMSRAKNAGVENIIEPRLIKNADVFSDLKQTADFALLFAVAHEVPDKEDLFLKLSSMMKKDGVLLFAEPAGHVKEKAFKESVSLAEKAGFVKVNDLIIKRSHAVLLKKG